MSSLSQQAHERSTWLRSAGARLLCGMISDSGGILRAKAVPAARAEAFATSGMGASLTWPVFCVDNFVAMTPAIGVTGDLRLVADLSAATVLDNGFAWCPADVYTQDGSRSPLCWRDPVRRQVDRLERLGVSTRAAYEMEFTVLTAPAARIGDAAGWIGYGAGELSSVSGLITDVAERMAAAGVPLEQVHAEYGIGQFELSLPPLAPLAAADAVLLARTVIGRSAREHGLYVSFSPMPFEGGSGNGAHAHLSFARDSVPLLSGGEGPAALTSDGAHLIAGLVDGVSSMVAVLAGSVVSMDRLVPGHWSGAFGCWGVENREAAVRMLTATAGNPHGANVEVKCIDAAANPYLAMGLLLGLAANGLENKAPLPIEVPGNPADLTKAEAAAAHVTRLPATLSAALDAFESSAAAAEILGGELHAAVTAVRRHELGLSTSDGLYAKTRFAWSA